MENPSLKPLAGHLYMVATPIGNLADLTERARAILSAVDLIACEDTRTTGSMLGRLGIHRDLLAYHEHNEIETAEKLVEMLAAGKSIALVTDAGTPGISDPGFRVVRACRRRKLPVVPVPGASALMSVLSASGLPTNGFLFVGFLPPKTAARRNFLEKYRNFDYTLCIYESCHRIIAFSEEMAEVLGPTRVICIAKELTKVHEKFVVGNAAEVRDFLAKMSIKGEFVVLIAPVDFTL
jgi:16S rRNA (cytidine1402-2'-O)-methyltransferase